MAEGIEAAAVETPVSSVEKLHAIIHAAGGQEPEDEQGALMLSVFRMAAPIMASSLPDDPAELDALLLKGAVWALSLRSDGAAEPETVAELRGLFGG